MINHYRNVPLINFDTRKETLRDTSKVKAIVDLKKGYLDAFNNSTLSNNFKKIVRQNIDAYLTLIKMELQYIILNIVTKHSRTCMMTIFCLTIIPF